jgi:hypothetical protein
MTGRKVLPVMFISSVNLRIICLFVATLQGLLTLFESLLPGTIFLHNKAEGEQFSYVR